MDPQFNILALIEAGRVKEDDDTLGIMQNITREQAGAIADWLCLATGAPVKLRLIGFDGVEYIERVPETLKIVAMTQYPMKGPAT